MEGSVTRGTHILQSKCNKNREMIDLFNLLNSTLSRSDPRVLATFPERIKALQSDIIELDNLFLSYEAKVGHLTPAEQLLLDENKNLQEQLHGLYSSLMPRIHTVKAAIAGEMKSLKLGRKAMTGYGATLSQGGQLINKSM